MQKNEVALVRVRVDDDDDVALLLFRFSTLLRRGLSSSLEKVLKAAATEDNTVILTTLNEAWAASDSVIDLFLESFRIGDQTRNLLDHLVIVALDKKAYQRCSTIHIYCFSLITKGVNFSGEAYFMSSDYLKMMWRRIDFLRSVLEIGYNFVFTDADVMWFRDPFMHFNSDEDFQIACDHFLGDPFDLGNRPNAGFNYVKSNKKTIDFYKFWLSSRGKFPGHHDQDVLNIIKYDPFVKEIGLKMRFLDTAYFGGLCEPSRNLNQENLEDCLQMAAVLTSRMVLSSAHAKCPTRVCKTDSKNRITTPDGLGSLKTVGMLRMKSSPVPVGRLVITKASGTEGGLPSSTTSSGNGMNLVFVGAEVGPWSKTGGLGDVLGGLPPALAALGHRVMTVCPRYDQYADAWDTNVLVQIRVGDQVETVRFFHCYKRGVDRVFVDHPLFLERVWGKTASKIYGPVTGIDYGDNQLRFSLMCQGVSEQRHRSMELYIYSGRVA
ncbi:hypothetical protein AKJ16_DCAP26032 [Drosera capensis]